MAKEMDWKTLEGKRVCVALSGGADSVALLHFLRARATVVGFALSAVNCEHGLRGEASLADTAFCQELCKRWEIPIFTFLEDCLERARREKCSVETAALNFRYESFEKILESEADYIALGHHADDEAETVLFRLCRGSSLTGAKGMTEVSGRYLRPFLTKTKEEILRYCDENGLAFCTDESNFQTDATRNRLRLLVLPELENAIHGAKENLCRFARSAEEDDQYLYSLAEPLLKKRANGEYALQMDCPKPLFYHACLLAMKRLGVMKDYTRKNLESAYALVGLQTGATADLKDGVKAKREYGEIVFFREIERLPFCENFRTGDFDGGRVAFNVANVPVCGAKKALAFDGDKVGEAVFRYPEEGDTFQKFGGGTKSLKKYLVDKKIPSRERATLPVLARGREILLIVGVEIAESVKITENTTNKLYINIKETE
jgi:tRNA(Ile)-lysidine synthase